MFDELETPSISPGRDIDCIVIGHNDVDFAAFSETQKQFAEISAGYNECFTNSVNLDGKRHTYTELLNKVLNRARGGQHILNAFQVPSLAVAYLVNFLCQRGVRADTLNLRARRSTWNAVSTN
jgi:hypothetical protein